MLGLMGGTFDPVHYGHLLMCENIREEFNLDKILFIPDRLPPHKSINSITDAEDRLRMVRLAVKGNPWFEVSDIEMRRASASYTVDTLKILNGTLHEKEKLYLIMGSDSFVQIESWKNYREIFNQTALIIAQRPDTDEILLGELINKYKRAMNAEILKSKHKPMAYSSTEIRERVKKGLSIRYMVPPEVEDYIYEKGLYRSV